MGNSYQKLVDPKKEAVNNALRCATNYSNNNKSIVALLESGADPMISVSTNLFDDQSPILYVTAVSGRVPLFKVMYKYADNPDNLELLKHVISNAQDKTRMEDIYNFILEIDQSILQLPNATILINHIVKTMSERDKYYPPMLKLCILILQKNHNIMADTDIRTFLMKAACRVDQLELLKLFSEYNYCFDKGCLLEIAAKHNATQVAEYLIKEQHILETDGLHLGCILEYATKKNNSQLITMCTERSN